MQERGELRQVETVVAVVVVVVAGEPADAAGRPPGFAWGRPRGRLAGIARQGRADQAFEAALGCVRGHGGGAYGTARASSRLARGVLV